jgi:hypothetical protein
MLTLRAGRQSLARVTPIATHYDEPSCCLNAAGPSRPRRTFLTTPSLLQGEAEPPQVFRPPKTNKRRRVGLVTAKNFAQGLKSLKTELLPPATPSSTTSQDTIHQVLSIARRTSSGPPSLADLEQLRPPPPDIPKYYGDYVEAHKRVAMNLDNAFVTRQLRRLASQLNVKGVSKIDKPGLVEQIMVLGGWTEPELTPYEQRAESEQGELRLNEITLH